MPSSVPPLPAVPVADAGTLRAVDRARVALRCGEVVAVEGETDCEGDTGRLALVLAVETLSAEALDRLDALGGGAPVLALTRWRAAALGLVAVGGAEVMTLTPASALRAETIHALVEPGGNLLGTVAAAEPLAVAAVRLTKLAALLPTAVVAMVKVNSGESAAAWCRRHDLRLVGAAAIAGYRQQEARALRRVAEGRVPLAEVADARIIAFRPSNGGHEHLAIVIGAPQAEEPVLVRLHSECFTGDLLGSLRCDCGDQLRRAIAAIAAVGSGIVLYLAQEGRGIGLVNKLRAYALQDQGYDTLDANEWLGFDADERLYLPAAEMLQQLGIAQVRLMTNNPDKVNQLARCGITVVERVPHIMPDNDHNRAYLRTKALRGGHMF